MWDPQLRTVAWINMGFYMLDMATMISFCMRVSLFRHGGTENARESRKETLLGPNGYAWLWYCSPYNGRRKWGRASKAWSLLQRIFEDSNKMETSFANTVGLLKWFLSSSWRLLNFQIPNNRNIFYFSPWRLLVANCKRKTEDLCRRVQFQCLTLTLPSIGTPNDGAANKEHPQNLRPLAMMVTC